jgi:hypothetical protein
LRAPDREHHDTRGLDLMRPSCALCFLCIGLLSAGCGSREPDASQPIQGDEVLGEVAALVRRHQEEHKRPPATPADLDPYGSSLSHGYSALVSGQYVLIWNVGLSDDPSAAAAVLAYHKDAPTQGGHVLMQNGEVKKMTADEFQAAIRGAPR